MNCPLRVIAAKAGTQERRLGIDDRRLRSWVPAFAGMTLVVALAGCGRDEPEARKPAAAPAKAPAAPAVEGDVGAAERLVRQRLGNPQGLVFSNPRRGASEGVAIVCGDYEQAGARHRYIVVDREDVFIEPQMRPGEMDRAFREFCGDGERG